MQKKTTIFSPGNVFLLILLTCGIAFCAFIPYGAGFDEEQHILRIYDISGLHLLPNRSAPEGTVGFGEFFTLSYQRRFYQTPANDLFEPQNFWMTPNYDSMGMSMTRSIYSPVIFLPQALLSGIFWRFFELPIIPVTIVLRLAGLLLYGAAAYVTLRLLPAGKWVFAVLALSPMALFQAATLNADGFTNAVSFLFIGLTLSIYASSAPVKPLKYWLLAGLALLLGFAKPGAIVLLPLLLILLRKNIGRPAWLLIAVSAALAVAVNLGWTALAVPGSHFASGGSQSLVRQTGLLLQNLGDFVLNYFRGAFASFLPYFRDWTGVYGYWVGMVPEPVYILYPLALAAALLAEPRTPLFDFKVRLTIFGAFLVSSGAVLFLYYLINYTPGDISSLGRQGRYFIPTAPLFFLALAGLFHLPSNLRRLAAGGSAAVLVAALGFYSFGLYTSYYTECGYGIYAGQPCVLPVYKNLEKNDPPVVPVNDDRTVEQQFTDTCQTLEAVQVLISALPVSAPDAARLNFALVNSDGQTLAEQAFELSDLAIDDYLNLPLQPPASLPTGTYTLLVSATGLPAPASVDLGVRPGNLYPGALLLDGAPDEADLIFRYVCANPFR
jgi:hypothetical protein